MVSAGQTNPVTNMVMVATGRQHVKVLPGESTSPEGSDSQSETRKGKTETGSESDGQSRTKPPASGGLKTGSPDCKVKAT
jgi:hypothetical protein